MNPLIDYFIVVFKKFISELDQEFPEHEILLQNVLNYLPTSEKDSEDDFLTKLTIIQQFKSISEHNYQLLHDKNYDIFISDDSLEFILGLDFRQIWHPNLTETSKEAIMGYLNLLTVTAHHIDLENTSYVEDTDIMSTLMDTMTGGTNLKDVSVDPNELNSLIDTLDLGETPAGDVFKDVLSDVTTHVTSMLHDGKNPLELLTGMLNPQEGSEMTQFMDSISAKMENKIQSGEIKQEDLISMSNNVLKSINPDSNNGTVHISANLLHSIEQIGSQRPELIMGGDGTEPKISLNTGNEKYSNVSRKSRTRSGRNRKNGKK